MPAIVAVLWLYGYASHLILSKYLIAVRGTGQEKYTGLILIQIWNLAKLTCGVIDYGLEWRSRRKGLGDLLSSMSDGIIYNPVDQVYARGSRRLPEPPSFGGVCEDIGGFQSIVNYANRHTLHGRAFASFSDNADHSDDEVCPSDSTFEDVPIRPQEHLSELENSGDFYQGCSVGCCGLNNEIFARSITRDIRVLNSQNSHVMNNLAQLNNGIQWRWFSWFIQGWLEMAALCITFEALRWTFVGDCYFHRYWIVVFIAVMQMFLDEETLNHSVIGLSLIVFGLTAKVTLGTLTPPWCSHQIYLGCYKPAGNDSLYLETTAGSYLAFAAGVVYSLQMFLHELCVELMPTCGGYKCLIPEAIGALYLCWSIYPLMIEIGSTEIRSGLDNLRQHWAVSLWYATSCLIAVVATVLQRRYSSPFSRSVAFIMQLPIVYFVETVILRWHVWRIRDVIIIAVFLLGFSTMTATWPTTILGKHVHGFLNQKAFVKPRFMMDIVSAIQNFFSTFHGGFRLSRENSFAVRTNRLP